MGFFHYLSTFFECEKDSKESLGPSPPVQSSELTNLVQGEKMLLCGSLHGRPLTSVDVGRVIAYFEERNIRPVYADEHGAPTSFSPRVYFVNNVVVLVEGYNRYLTLVGNSSASNALSECLKKELCLQEKRSAVL
mgnify:FL=1